MSAAEIKLWSHLRGNQLLGLRFRRQHPIGRYIVDFACLAKRLVIEVDGDSHGDGVQARHDEERTAYLLGLGLRVLRFTNWDVLENLDGVLNEISKHVS